MGGIKFDELHAPSDLAPLANLPPPPQKRPIRRVYEVDPLYCPQCGGQMKIVSFIERRQADVIERMLRQAGLWEGPIRTLANARAPPGPYPTSPEPGEFELMLDGDYLDAQHAIDARHGGALIRYISM